MFRLMMDKSFIYFVLTQIFWFIDVKYLFFNSLLAMY
jgi:hypothetical protein